jgi:hypothetical protein
MERGATGGKRPETPAHEAQIAGLREVAELLRRQLDDVRADHSAHGGAFPCPAPSSKSLPETCPCCTPRLFAAPIPIKMAAGVVPVPDD